MKSPKNHRRSSSRPGSLRCRRKAAGILAFTALIAASSLPVFAPFSRAATLFWDGGIQTVNGASDGGSGTWSTAVANWDNGTAEVVWPGTGFTAVFGGTAGTVTLGTAITADEVNFAVSGYTIASPSFVLTLGSTGTGAASAIYTNSTGGTADTISGPIVFSASGSAINTITTGGASDVLNLSGAISSSAPTTDGFTIAGLGTVNYSGTTGTTAATTIGKFNVTGGTFSDTGGTLTLLNQTYVGVNGTGTAPIFNVNGGTVAAGTLILQVGSSGNLGTFSISSGTASFASINAGNVFNAATGTGDGNGTITVSGGTLNNGGNLILGSAKSGVGVVNLNGGTLNMVGNFLQNAGATGTGGSSTINFNGTQLNLTGTTAATFIPASFTLNVGAGGAKINTNNAVAFTILAPLLNGGGTDGGLTKTGTSTLTLGGVNTYNGPTVLTAGTLALANTAAQTLAGAISGVGAVSQTGAGTTTLSATGNSFTGGTTVSAGTLNLSGTFTGSANNISVTGGAFTESGSGVIATAAGTLSITGPGTSTLSGINTYTGATTVTNSTLNLDFSGATAPATASNIIKSTNTINLSGSTLAVKGGGTGTNTQTFGTTALTANTQSFITTNLNGGTALNLALGGITRNGATALDITFSTGTGSVTTSTAQAPSNGILVNSANVAYATANGGASWVSKAAGTSPFALTPLTTYSTGTANYLAANNVDVTTGDSVSGVTVNTLRLNSASDALTLSGTNVVSTGGILATPTGTGSTISGGTLTAGSGNEFVLQGYGALNIGSTIADNGSATAVTIAGTGLTTLSGANTYTGNTTIVGTGGLRLGSATAVQNSTLIFSPIGTSSNLSFASGIGTFTAGGLTGSTNAANILTLTDAGGTAVNLQVGNNNANTAFVGGIAGGTITKIGTGTLTLNSGNNITSAFVVNNGSVFSNNINSLQNSPSVTINNGGVVYYGRGSVLIASGAATDTVTVNSGGIISSDYLATSGSADTAIGAITLNGGSIQTRNQPTTGTPLIYDRGTFGFGNYTGAVAGTAAVTAGGGTNPTSTISAVNAGLRETGGTIFNVAAGSGTGGSASPTGGVDLLFSGTVLSRSNNGNTTLIKQGNGVMELTGGNTFITPVQVNAGILQINSIANGGVQTTATGTSGATSVTVASATGIAAGQAVGFGTGSNINAGTTVGSGYTAGATTVPLAIPTNATDTGTIGTVNTTLTFGAANPLGISTNVASNLIIDGGTLQYVGAAAGSTDRLFQVGAATAGSTSTIDSSGTGALSFTNAGALTYGTTAQARTLGLSGTNTGANTLAPSIGNNTTAAVSVTKSGAGSWTLAGNNTYTGATTVSGGILTATGAGANKALGGTTSIAVNNGGTLLLGAASQASAAAAITLGTTAAQTPASTTGILSLAAGANQGTAATVTGGTVSGGMTTGGTITGMTAAGLGTLSLSNTATLAFGGTATTLTFGTFAPNGNVLTITGYTNTTAQTPGSSGAATDDRLIFSGDQSGNFNNFNFGAGPGAGVGEVALDGGYFEVTAVPEPSARFVTALGVLGLVGGWLLKRCRGSAPGI